ncbi:Uncharacterised protein [Vibrio cholerae]|nr:Uncharacterised protein [Vibrio cholerae]
MPIQPLTSPQKMRWTKLLASVALPFICRVATFPCCHAIWLMSFAL